MENENVVIEPKENEEQAVDAEGVEPVEADLPEDAGSFGDGDEGTPSAEKKQAGVKSAKQAEKRRAREAVDAAERNAIIIETLGGKNPFTGGDMVDQEDVEEYLLQKEIEKSGGDPVSDLAAYRKQKSREKREAEEKGEADKERTAREMGEFRDKYPDIDLGELFENEDFRDYADGKLGRKSISEVYAGFMGFKKKLGGARDEKEDAKKAQVAANQKASVGSLASSHKESQDFYTPDQVRAMSKEEIHANFEKIQKSMKKWK